MRFNDQDARGQVRLLKGVYGPTLVVNGREIGYVDLQPCTEEGPPQIIFFHERLPDEVFAKIVLEPDGMVAVINCAAVEGKTDSTIHNNGSDRLYTWPTGEAV